MPHTVRHTFKKSERLCSRILMDRLFQGDNRSVSAYPIRAVFLPVEPTAQQGVSVLISVPKKRFKHAVKRNLVKRQIREAYRHHKHILTDALEQRETPQKMVMAFIWLDNKVHDTEEVEIKVKKLLYHIAEDKL